MTDHAETDRASDGLPPRRPPSDRSRPEGPPALCLVLIRMVGLLVPHDQRREWRDEWEAEVHHRWLRLRRARGGAPPSAAARLSLLARTAGCLPHALWLWKEEWRLRMLWEDLRYAVRTLVRRPGFTLLASLTLALAIGALTAIFSIVYTVLLKPLPYHEPDRLVQIWEHNPAKGWTQNIVAPANLLDWRDRTRTLAGIAGYFATPTSDGGGANMTITGAGEPETVRGLGVTANLFDLLGVRAARGRTFTADDEQPGRSAVVISDGLWRRRFGGRPDVIGQTIPINGRPREIIGVMPPDFGFPSHAIDLWAGLGMDRAQMLQLRRPHMLRAIARLRPGVTLEQARADLRGIMTQLSQEYPDTNKTMGADLGPQQEWVVGHSRRTLLLFLGAVSFVLLIACTNVASLLMVQGVARARELAVRGALGARRGRLIRQLLTESLVLSAIGAALGLLLTIWAVRLFVTLSPGDVPRLDEVRIDLPMLLFAGGIAALTTMLFGLLPALQSARPDLTQVLRDGGRGTGSGPRGDRLRRTLIAAEVALAVLLVICAGLFVRSFTRLQAVSPGVTRDRVVTFGLSLPGARYAGPLDVVAFSARLLPALGAIPGVRGAGATSGLPLTGGGWSGDSTIEGRAPDDYIMEVGHISVSPAYFDTVGLAIRDGRGFTASDTHDAAPVVIINETLAARYFAHETPIGRRITFAKPSSPGRWFTIVGVVEDERQEGLRVDVRPRIYQPTLQAPVQAFSIALRADVPAAALMPQVRQAVRALDPALAIEQVRTLDELIAASVSAERFAMLLMAAFAALALALASVGIYGVVSFTVSQRTQEIGLRLALGASPGLIRRLVIGRALQPVIVGLIAGVAAALAATRLLAHQLFEVSPTDPATFVIVTLLLLGVAIVASYIPARRAMRVDPMEALRLD